MLKKKVLSCLLGFAVLISTIPVSLANTFASDTNFASDTTSVDVSTTTQTKVDNSWIATPYYKENGQLVEGLEDSVRGKKNWLETTDLMPTVTTEDKVNGFVTMSNGSISRQFKVPSIGGTEFYTNSYKNTYIDKELMKDEKKADVYVGLYDKKYSDIYDQKIIKCEPEYYYVGGTETNNTFVFDGYQIFSECEKPFDWEPHEIYGDPAAEAWPPKGNRVEFNFSAPITFPEAYQGLKIKVVYEMYSNSAAMKKKVIITNTKDNFVTVGKIAPEVLNGNENMSELMHMETNYIVGGTYEMPIIEPACNCKNETGKFKDLLQYKHTCYREGPAYQLFKDQVFETFETYEMVYSTYWFELRARERLGMYRKMFPWITDNATTYHCTKPLTKEEIDQAAEAGFEMVIQSFGINTEARQMMTRDKEAIKRTKEVIDYAHSRGIDVGFYQAQHGQNDYKVDYEYGKNDIGTFGIHCFASAAADDYLDTLQNFLIETGADAVELDGAYTTHCCDKGEVHVNKDRYADPQNPLETEAGHPSKYAMHNGYYDSAVKQWENAVRHLSKFCRDRGIMVRTPAWYYRSGGNKNTIGYEEIAWSQPRQEQFIYGRQTMYNASYIKTMSMCWTHIPFSQYHGGGEAAFFLPFKDHLEDYNWVVAQNLGNGITGDFRGAALYDEESLPIMKKWVAFNKKYKGIINSDLVHISQAAYEPEGTIRNRTIKMDTMFHVNANNPGEKGLLWVYNQSDEVKREIINVPMYYTGLTNMNYPQVPVKNSTGKNVHSYGTSSPNFSWLPNKEPNYTLPNVTKETTGTATFVHEGVEVENITVDSNGNAQIMVTLQPMSFTYYTIYPEGQAPEVEVNVGKVKSVKVDEAKDRSIALSWNNNVDIIIKEEGKPDSLGTASYYNVYRDGNFVGKTITNSYVDNNLEENTEYSYEVEAVVTTYVGEKSDAVKATTISDITKPCVVSLTSTSKNKVIVKFSEKVDTITAVDVSNYTLSSGVVISKAELAADSDGMEVVLSVSDLQPLKEYTVTIKEIADRSEYKNMIDAKEYVVQYGYLRSYTFDDLKDGVLVDYTHGKNGTTSKVTVSELQYGKCGKFSASEKAYGELGTDILKGLKNYSIDMWVNTCGDEKQVLYSQGQDGVAENDFTLYVENGLLKFRTSNPDGEEVTLVSDKAIDKYKWNYVTLVRDNDVFSLYLDGELVGQKEQSGIESMDTLNVIYIGAMKNDAGGDRTAFLTGMLDDLSIYNVSLTQENVNKMYHKKYQAFMPVLTTAKTFSEEFYTSESYIRMKEATTSLENIISTGQYEVEQAMAALDTLETAIGSMQKKDMYQNLVSWLSMDEQNGDVVKDSVSGDNNIFVNGKYSRLGTPFNKGVYLTDVRNSYIQIPNSKITNLQNYSVTGWFKPQLFNTTGGKQTIISDAKGHLNLYVENNILKLDVKGETQKLNLVASKAIVYDQLVQEKRQAWNSFAITRENNSWSLYLNGEKVAGGSKADLGVITGDVYIGAVNNAGNVSCKFNGIVDEFAFYSKALSDQEVLNLLPKLKFNKTAATNLAIGKTITSNPDSNNKAYAIDGKCLDGSNTSAGNVLSFRLDLDLGNNYAIDAVGLVTFKRPYGQYTGTGQAGLRHYRDVIIQTSTTPDFSAGVTTILNNDNDNSLGQGTGKDEMYISTDLGNDVILNAPVYGRYIRLYSGGFYCEDGQYAPYMNIHELEVYGKSVGTFTTTFNVDGTETVVTTNGGESAISPVNPTKEGYIFKGWYTAVSEGIEVTEFKKTQTVYAQWTKYTDQFLTNYFSMDEPNGEVVKDTVSAKNGVLINGNYARLGTPFKKGVYITEVRNNYVLIKNSGIIGLENYTIAGWFKYQLFNATGGKQTILSDEKGHINLYVENNSLKLDVKGKNQTLNLASSKPIKYDKFTKETRQAWNSFTIVREKTSWSLYLNGEKVAEGSKADLGVMTGDVYIGGVNNGKSVICKFNGIVDEVAFYSKNLVPKDVLNLVPKMKFNKVVATNLAIGKTIMSSPDSNNKVYAIDGKSIDGANVSAGKVPSLKLDLDLGKSYAIDAISFVTFFRKYGNYSGTGQAGLRHYKDVIIQTSTVQDFSSNVTTIFNNDADNSLGLGVGKDEMFISTELGNDIILNTPAYGRYVRMYSGGFYCENANYEPYMNINELEVWQNN